MYLLLLLLFLQLFLHCKCVLPPYLPILANNNFERGDLIEQYFHLGLGYSEIVQFLGLLHGCLLSIRQLKRILQRRGLGRRKNRSEIEEVYRAIRRELRGSRSTMGYRQMTRRLLHSHGVIVDKETVRELLKILDPEGVNARSRHRLQRRQYKTEGPNHVWHIDGYDKLKPFGFCIHGSIDGYSRRVMWLDVGPSNNDPRIIAQYYTECVQQIGGTARVIRGDCGTENVHVAALQRFFNNNEQSFVYGRSCYNQRIEAFWGMLRRGCVDWWINFFKDLRDSGLFCDADDIQVECLKFCFISMLREELYEFAMEWNLHRIRKSVNPESPGGQPDVLYFLSSMTDDVRDLITPVSEEDIEIAQQRCCIQVPEHGCSEEFVELASIIMLENHLEMPSNPEDGVILYSTILENIWDIM